MAATSAGFSFQGRMFADYTEFLDFVDNDESINMTNEEKMIEFQRMSERRRRKSKVEFEFPKEESNIEYPEEVTESSPLQQTTSQEGMHW